MDAVTGEGRTADGAVLHPPCGLSLRELADAIPAGVGTVYLCGQLPSAAGITAANGELYSSFNSWLLADASALEHVRLDSGATHDQTFAQVRRAGGAPLGLYSAASWFSTLNLSPAEAVAAHADVTRALQSQPGWENAFLLDTSARTGLDLWRASIGMHSVNGERRSLAYPVLPGDVRTLIRATEGQGRFELLPPPAGTGGKASALAYLDMRLAYAAPALHDLGCGPVTHDHGGGYEGFHPARCRITYHVPDGWAHLGLFMTKDASGNWIFPRSPGEMHEAWADAAELRIALGPFPSSCPDCARCYRVNDGACCPQHGWPFTIHERLLFTPGHKPLRTWAQKLIAARDTCESEPARAAIRNILLHAIGAFHGSRRSVTRYGSPQCAPDNVPLRAILTASGDEVYTWDDPGVAPKFPDYDRPEWSSQVWAKTRARLLLHRDFDTKHYVGALALPFDRIVAPRLDALITTANPEWRDSGRPGAFRVKGFVSGPLPWPREESDLAILNEATERNSS
jgi:hypothetical protein